jgi:hypothetical protein
VPLLSTVDEEQGLADVMRKHFELAGCSEERVERFKSKNSEELPLRFRSWRDAGCTWAIVEGTDVVKVQRRAGHKLIATTMKYVVEAENRSAAFGVPFPPLPLSLLRASKSASNDSGPFTHGGTDLDLTDKPANGGLYPCAIEFWRTASGNLTGRVASDSVDRTLAVVAGNIYPGMWVLAMASSSADGVFRQ